MALIRLCICAGWSESLLVTHITLSEISLWLIFVSCSTQMSIYFELPIKTKLLKKKTFHTFLRCIYPANNVKMSTINFNICKDKFNAQLSSKKKSFITSLPLTTHIPCFHGESTREPVLKRFWYLSLVSSHSLHMPAQLSSGTSIVNVDLSLHLHPYFDFFCLIMSQSTFFQSCLNGSS